MHLTLYGIVVFSQIFFVYCDPVALPPHHHGNNYDSYDDLVDIFDDNSRTSEETSASEERKFKTTVCWSTILNTHGICKKSHACIKTGGTASSGINCGFSRVCCVYAINIVTTTTKPPTTMPVTIPTTTPTTASTPRPTTPTTPLTTTPTTTSTSTSTTTSPCTSTSTPTPTTTTVTSTTTTTQTNANQQLTNPNYPAAFNEGGTFPYKITKATANSCQILLEFVQLNLAQPDIETGMCIYDLLVISNGAEYFPRICGNNSGQAMYVDFYKDDPILINIDLSAQISIERKWNLQVTQLTCDFPA